MNKRVLFSAALIAVLGGPAAFAQTAAWTARDLGSAATSAGVTDMDMPAPNVVWGIQYDGSGGGATIQDFFVTTDAGATWFTGMVATANSADKRLSNVSAIDGMTAYIGGFDAMAGGGLLFKTVDGGNNFTEVPVPTFAYLNVVHFFDANTGVMMGDPTQGDYEVFRTTDAGATWTRVPGANMPNAVAGDYGLTNQYYAVGDHIWFSTLKGRVYHSMDRGLNWTVGDTGFRDTPQAQAINNISFSESMIGLAVASNGDIKRSTDGGATWTALTPVGPVFSNSVESVPGTPSTFVGVNVSPAAGLGSSYSTDGGLNWIALDSTVQYTNVVFWDGQHGWAGGFTGASGVGGVYEYTGAALGPLVPLATPRSIVREVSAAYPNPTTGVLRLAGTDPRETVTVYDQAGRVALRQSVGTAASLDLSAQPAGLYHLVFTGGKVTRTTRVAVAR